MLGEHRVAHDAVDRLFLRVGDASLLQHAIDVRTHASVGRAMHACEPRWIVVGDAGLRRGKRSWSGHDVDSRRAAGNGHCHEQSAQDQAVAGGTMLLLVALHLLHLVS